MIAYEGRPGVVPAGGVVGVEQGVDGLVEIDGALGDERPGLAAYTEPRVMTCGSRSYSQAA